MRSMIRAAMILFVSILLGSCATAGIESGTETVVSSGTVVTEEEWESAYQSFLDKIYKNSTSPDDLYFFLKDIDSTAPPELFVIDHAAEYSDPMKVYTYTSDVEEIGSRFLQGSTRLLYSENPACPGIFTFGVGGGLERYGYITIQNNELLETELWNEDYSGISKELGKDRERIEELSSDKLLISESKRVYEKNQDIEKIKLSPENVLSDSLS